MTGRARTLLPIAAASLGGTAVAVAGGAVEVAVLALAATRIRRIVRVARAHPGPGPVAALEAGLTAARLPRAIAAVVAGEVAAIVLTLGGPFRRAPRDGFSMHRRKSWTAIALVILGLIAGESLAMHVVLAHWSTTAAWLATASSMYAALWLLGDLHALRLYPLRVTDDAIAVSVGLRWRLTIPRDAIASIQLGDTVPPGALSARVVEPTVIVTLIRPVEASGPFGRRRTVSVVALTVDEPERLIAALAR